eukprot:TRINITY_DN12806_c0_g5_i1.p1 TRINITY_DN12806_c0_g5~~TRINITY_DN12806_c0_g5_i1.p1  ORF type:complete len:158 (+),score=2.88 TRINITY_DN12806_c0_g5_i1:750-1223(+)
MLCHWIGSFCSYNNTPRPIPNETQSLRCQPELLNNGLQRLFGGRYAVCSGNGLSGPKETSPYGSQASPQRKVHFVQGPGAGHSSSAPGFSGGSAFRPAEGSGSSWQSPHFSMEEGRGYSNLLKSVCKSGVVSDTKVFGTAKNTEENFKEEGKPNDLD